MSCGLRENGFAAVRAEGARRVYSVDSLALRQVHAWLDQFSAFWPERLNVLTAEIARGKRERRARPSD